MAIKTTQDLLQEILDGAASNFRRYVEMDAAALPFMAQGTSPIEQVVGMGLWAYVCLFNYGAAPDADGKLLTATFMPAVNLDLSALMAIEHSPYLSVWHQVRVDNYRADFVILCRNPNGNKWVAVECDGHDHHNLTKSQAEHDRARDRHFQARGLSILRFTGSEIWRDPTKAPAEALMFAMDRMAP